MNPFRKFRALFSKRKLESDMAEEMRHHVELQTELNLKAGMKSDDARYAALRQFGNVAVVQEQAREVRGWVWLEQFWQDLRYAGRALRKSRGFTLIAVISLALGIGANTAVFSLVNQRLLKPLPVKNPGELVLFQWQPGQKYATPPALEEDWGGRELVFSQRTFDRFIEEHAPLTDVFASASMWMINVSIDHQAEVLGAGELVSGNFFRAIGVPAWRGRMLLPEDDRPGAAPAAVISFRYWHKRFDGDTAAVGKTIIVNGVQATVVGIAPPGFLGTMLSWQGEDIFLPLLLAPQIRRNAGHVTAPGKWWLRIVGRLKPGTTLAQVQAGMEGIFLESVRDEFPQQDRDSLPRLNVTPGGMAQTEFERKREIDLLLPMVGMAGLLLVAASANVAALLLARGVSRRREIAVRLALGASRGRLIRQLLIESVLLGLSGALLGLLFSRWNLDLLGLMLPPEAMALGQQTQLDWRVLCFTGITALFISLLFGLAPALRATRLNLTAEFQGGAGGRGLGGGGMSRLSQTLVAVQVAVSLVLLVGTGLFLRTVQNLQAIDIGFDRSQLLLFMINGNGAGTQPAQFAQLHESVSARIGALPGVRSVSVSAWPLVCGMYGQMSEFAHAGSSSPPGNRPFVTWNPVSPDFFKTYGISLLAGRSFDSSDLATGHLVAIINQTLAKEYFKDENPVGRHISFHGEREIIGVVRDTKQSGFDLRDPMAPLIYLPFAQDARAFGCFAVRTEGAPESLVPTVRNAVREIHPDLPLFAVRTQEKQMNELFLRERIFAPVAGFIGLITLTLSCVGLYGLISYTVFRRTGEIGVRMALGALPGGVHWMIIRESLTIVFVGIVAGIAAAAALTQLFWAMLFNLSPTDPFTYGAVVFFLFGIALFACWLPARRATQVDPVVALRAE